MDREMGVECLLLGGLGNDAQMPGLRLPSPVQSAHPDLPYHNVSEKAMATHSRTLAWRMPGMGEPGGLPSMGSHRVRHDWSDLAAAAATHVCCKSECHTQVHLIPGEAQEYSSLPLRVPIQPVLEAVTSGGQHCKVVRTGWGSEGYCLQEEGAGRRGLRGGDVVKDGGKEDGKVHLLCLAWPITTTETSVPATCKRDEGAQKIGSAPDFRSSHQRSLRRTWPVQINHLCEFWLYISPSTEAWK